MVKQAKIAHRQREAESRLPAASAHVMITGAGHRVSRSASGRADCGELMTGWRFGRLEEVLCRTCTDE